MCCEGKKPTEPAEGEKEKRRKGSLKRYRKVMLRGEGRNLQNMVLIAEGKKEMDGDHLQGSQKLKMLQRVIRQWDISVIS